MALAAGADHYRIECAHDTELRFPRFVSIGRFLYRPGENAFLRDDHEQCNVNGVNAFTKNSALPSALTFRLKKRECVLEVIGLHVAAECLDRLQRNTVARIDVSH